MQLTKIYKEPRVCPPVPPRQLVVSHQRSVVRIKQACDGARSWTLWTLWTPDQCHQCLRSGAPDAAQSVDADNTNTSAGLDSGHTPSNDSLGNLHQR